MPRQRGRCALPQLLGEEAQVRGFFQVDQQTRGGQYATLRPGERTVVGQQYGGCPGVLAQRGDHGFAGIARAPFGDGDRLVFIDAEQQGVGVGRQRAAGDGECREEWRVGMDDCRGARSFAVDGHMQGRHFAQVIAGGSLAVAQVKVQRQRGAWLITVEGGDQQALLAGQAQAQVAGGAGTQCLAVEEQAQRCRDVLFELLEEGDRVDGSSAHWGLLGWRVRSEGVIGFHVVEGAFGAGGGDVRVHHDPAGGTVAGQ